jgi:hypothetical protein
MTKQEDLCLKDLKVRLMKDKKKDDLWLVEN